jgi:hypothetical protein
VDARGQLKSGLVFHPHKKEFLDTNGKPTKKVRKLNLLEKKMEQAAPLDVNKLLRM